MAVEVTSRRNVLEPCALLFLSGVVIVDVLFFYFFRKHRTRFAAMAFVLTVLATTWTVAQTAAGLRWVEIPVPGTNSFARASNLVSTFTLSFDVLVEIVLAYLTFLALPVLVQTTVVRVGRPCSAISEPFDGL